MVQLELLNENNKIQLLQIQREDIPNIYVEDVSNTIALAEYGTECGLEGHCFAIKHCEKYVGIILLGEAIEDDADPNEVKGKKYFRILGFLIDNRYRGLGIGSMALNFAMKTIYAEYGKVIFLLECHKNNQKAIQFYEKNGFVNTKILNAQKTDYYLILR